jgi:hypothetical protein
MNVVGGFLITDRMLGMFKREPGRGRRQETVPEASGDGRKQAAGAS